MKSLTLLFSFFTVSLFSQCLVSYTDTNLIVFNPTEDIGQGFTAECDGNLEYVEFFSGGAGTVAAGTLNIYNGNSVSPANLIHTQAHPAITISAAGDPIRVDITSSVPVVLNSQYTFQFNVTGVSIVAKGDFYPGGTAFEDVRILPQFDIPFSASIVSPSSPLMITQYYEGTGSDKWLEVKNISNTATTAGDYFIGLFEDSFGTIGGGIETNTPISYQINFAIPAGGVVLFGNSVAGLPAPVNIGAATMIIDDGAADAICAFTGDDIIIISTSNDGTAYNNRTDILGIVDASTAVDWGTDVSIIKGCGTLEQPAIIYDPINVAYDPNQFIELTLDEVNIADPNTNIALGTQASGSTTWTTAWSDGTTDRTRDAVIDGAYVDSNGSFDSCNLTINAGASINLDSGASGSNYVLVDKDLTINGTFTIGDTESLITTDSIANITGVITKIERTTPLNNFRDYTYWSSPVSTTIEAAFVNLPFSAVGVDPNRIFRWRTPIDETSIGAGDGDPGNWEVASGFMEPGRGYLAEAPMSVTNGLQHQVNFTGTPNNGTVNVPVGIDTGQLEGYGGYNIIGNPYPSAIDIDLFIEALANPEIDADPTAVIDGTIWLWSHATQIDGGTTGEFAASDYVTYNLAGGVSTTEGTPAPTNIIGSGQGFLVQVFQVGNNEVTFENYMRVADENDTQFFKSNKKSLEEKDRIWLNMTNDEGDFNQTLIGFFDKATDGFDRGYDGLNLSSGNVVLYSTIEDNIYAIQGFGSFDQAREIPLGFYTTKEGKHKISIGKFEGVLANEEIYLVDNELNLVHDLKQDAYEFELVAAGNYKERFTLKFNGGVLSTDDLTLNNSFIVFNENSTLKVKAGNEVVTLKVYDITGRLLIDSEPKSAAFDLESQTIKAGTVLILNATMKNGSTVSKKVIKY